MQLREFKGCSDWKTLKGELICSQYLSRCVVGASAEELEEEEEEEEEQHEDKEPVEPPADQVYQVIGSLKDKTRPKPGFVKDVVLVSIGIHLRWDDYVGYGGSAHGIGVNPGGWGVVTPRFWDGGRGVSM